MIAAMHTCGWKLCSAIPIAGLEFANTYNCNWPFVLVVRMQHLLAAADHERSRAQLQGAAACDVETQSNPQEFTAVAESKSATHWYFERFRRESALVACEIKECNKITTYAWPHFCADSNSNSARATSSSTLTANRPADPAGLAMIAIGLA